MVSGIGSEPLELMVAVGIGPLGLVEVDGGLWMEGLLSVCFGFVAGLGFGWHDSWFGVTGWYCGMGVCFGGSWAFGEEFLPCCNRC